MHIQRAAGPGARALGAYPFDNSFTLGCHGPELGSHLDLTAAQPQSANAAGALDAPATDAGGIVTGWADVDGARPDCILIADQTGTVTGGGITGLPLTVGQATKAVSGATAWQATSGRTNGPLTVLAVRGGRLYRLN